MQLNYQAPETGLAPLAERPAAPEPSYLRKVYWWAYVHPNAVKVFERDWLINLILFGNYPALRDAALDELGICLDGCTLQIACAYGNLTPRLRERIASDGTLDVIDVLPIQLQNLRHKLPPDPRVSLYQRDSVALGFADASYDRVLLYFLLHEQPESVRRRTLEEACRVLKPGGKIVIIDYHGPAYWNPVRLPVRALLKRLEPFAGDLWDNEIATYLPPGVCFSTIAKTTYFGGLYQKLVLTS